MALQNRPTLMEELMKVCSRMISSMVTVNSHMLMATSIKENTGTQKGTATEFGHKKRDLNLPATKAFTKRVTEMGQELPIIITVEYMLVNGSWIKEKVKESEQCQMETQ